MIDGIPDDSQAQVPVKQPRWMQFGVLAAVCSLVVGVYAFVARPGYAVSSSLNPADAYYNLLVQGFRAGQLSVKREVPPGLAQLPNPYDRSANAPYGVLDLSYYKGKLYLYFGVTPVLVLFWPYLVLTGHYLPQKDATLIFCLVGFLTSAGLLFAAWRRYFAEVSVGVAAGALALGLATFAPFLLGRCDVYEVSISCGYAFTMLALAATWKALHEPERRGRWLAAASLAYGLAVGARPSLLLGAVILVVPIAQAWRERRKIWIPLIAATVPIVLIGLGLMLYNALRFDNPFEFGWHYQLAGGDPQDTIHPFGLHYLWFNFRVFFVRPAHWSSRFPFVHDITAPPRPAGHGGAEHCFGVLTNVPLVWLALAAPLAWRRRPAETRSTLRAFLAAVALFFGICTLTICLHRGANTRYEMEFLPALVWLAAIGVLSLERALAPTSDPGPICRPVWRRAARWVWGLLLGFSVAFNLLASTERCAEADYDLGNALLTLDEMPEAAAQYYQALRLKPDYADAHKSLGVALAREGKFDRAIEQFEEGLRLTPGDAKTHRNLGMALQEAGRMPEAIEQYQQALRIRPDYPEVHYNLAGILMQLDRPSDAIEHYEQALQLKSNPAKVHNDLAIALAQVGRTQEAITHWEEAVHLQPDYAEAHSNLAVALAQLGRMQEAMKHWEEALRLRPDYAEVHYNLGVALERMGRESEAVKHYEEALRLKPGYPEAQERLATLRLKQAPRQTVH
ncbi:MAG TPA: tetratricopeptide repeat protein [Verrucomicrobiae bacterium]|nr:tetratricopeptide repeat protein [Verrucomicrobiae bacterium]